jgi:predicted MFS family arabinose efflux permease
MNTANAIGYVIGAATGAWWSKHFSIRTAFIASLITSSLALLVTGATTSYAVLMALRFVGGIATAVAFMVGSSLAARIRHHLFIAGLLRGCRYRIIFCER